MYDPTVLILTGQSGSGKDSIFNRLQISNPNLPRFSFGDLLRREIYTDFDLDPVENERDPLMDSDGSKLAESFKHLMVHHGRAKILNDPHYYVRQLGDRIRKLSDDTGNGLVVVTDCRRPHELHEIRRQFRSYAFRLQYSGSKEMPLDRLLDNDPYIVTVPEMSIEAEVGFMIDYMIGKLPYGWEKHPLQH